MNLKLSTRIVVGLIIVNSLLGIIAYVAGNGLQNANQGFQQYRELARDTNLIGRLQANMLMVRMSVKDFLITGSSEAQEQYRHHLENTLGFLNSAREAITDPQRAKTVRDVAANLNEYQTAFTEAVQLTQTIKAATAQLTAKGEEMLASARLLTEAAHQNGNSRLLYRADQLQEQMLVGRLHVARYLASEHPDDFRQAQEAMTNRVSELLEELQPHLTEEPRYLPLVEALKAPYQDYLQAMNEEHRASQTRAALVESTLNRLGPVVGEQVEIMKMAITTEQNTLGPLLQAANQQRLWSVGAVVALCLLFSVGIGVWLTRTLIQAFRRAQEAVSQIAEGDLTATIESRGRDEVGELLRNLAVMQKQLKETVGAVRSAASSVNEGVRELNQGSADLGRRTESQASNLEETAASMEEMTATVRQNAEHTQQANQLSSEAQATAERGGKVVDEAVNAMSAINSSSRKIAEIIGVIDEIAFQTNLLALNAAVEAARAGEDGRGFAVVAAEVRNLAQRSATAAKEIKDLIQDNVSKVDGGTQLVNRAGANLTEIVEAVSRVSDIVEQIAQANAEQSSGIEQVNHAVIQMEEVTQQNAALVEQTSAASATIQQQTESLVRLISFFRVEGSSGAVAGPTNSSASAKAPAPKAAKTGLTLVAPPTSTPKPLPSPAATPKPAPALKKAVGGEHSEGDWEEF